MRRTSSAAAGRTSELLGCSFDDLHNHLAQMASDEEAVTVCDVDHIFPMVMYDAQQSSTHKKMCNYTNLQPLTGKENKDKSDKLPTKAMAARVDPACWPDGITMDMLPDIYPGWATPLRM